MCAGCPDLQELTDSEQILTGVGISFKTISINKHRHLCNCRCVYCSLWQGASDSYEILTPLKSLHTQNVLDKDCLFSWGGGEPGILREFEETSQWILSQGYRQYVHTNGLRFSPAIAALLQRETGGINISLDSACPETYKKVKGVNGFDRVTANLDAYLESAINKRAVHVKYIVFELNNSLKEIEKFFHLCQKTGVTDVQLSLNFNEVNTNTVSQQTLEAALLFIKLSHNLGMHCSPFFIDEKYLFKIQDIARKE